MEWAERAVRRLMDVVQGDIKLVGMRGEDAEDRWRQITVPKRKNKQKEKILVHLFGVFPSEGQKNAAKWGNQFVQVT